MLLAIDTSSFVLSCALAEKDKLVAEWTVQKRLTHSEQLIPHMDEILKDAGVDQRRLMPLLLPKDRGRLPVSVSDLLPRRQQLIYGKFRLLA